jgi:hypothetical protein
VVFSGVQRCLKFRLLYIRIVFTRIIQIYSQLCALMAACKESTNVIAPNGMNIDPAINEKELEFGRVNAKVSVVSIFRK